MLIKLILLHFINLTHKAHRKILIHKLKTVLVTLEDLRQSTLPESSKITENSLQRIRKTIFFTFVNKSYKLH